MKSLTVHQQINALFDATIARIAKRPKQLLPHERGFREYQIFVEALGDTAETRMLFLAFLHDVSTCPPKVIAWCQAELRK